MRHLLVVCYYFPPAAGGGVARVLSFVRHLPQHGWRVSVVCADPEAAPLRDPTRAASIPAGVDVRCVAGPPLVSRGRRAVIGRGAVRPTTLYRAARAATSWFLLPDSFAPWRKPAADAVVARLGEEPFDALLTSSPPDTVHLVGLDAVRRHPVPWVADFRDPWVGLTYKRPPTAWHRTHQKRLRAAVLEAADLVLAATETQVEKFRLLLPPGSSRRVHHLPNGWEDDVEIPAPPARGPGPVRVLYTGTLWDVQATRTCLIGLQKAVAERGAEGREHPIELEIVGPHESAEERLVARLGLGGSVRFAGQLPYAEARARQRQADVLLLLRVHGPGYEVSVPGKFFEYLATGLPILAFLGPGEAADLVREAGGWVVEPDDERGAARTFSRLIAGDRPQGDTPARQELAKRYRRDRIASHLAALLDQLVERRGRKAS
jgi:glycosyltransferase involved in cell wall biosynthesis